MSSSAKVKPVRVISMINGASMVILGGISLLMTLPPPLTAGFWVSIAVLMHGGIEWKFSGRLSRGEFSVLKGLAVNQLVMGCSVSTYALWKLIFFDKDSLSEVFESPLVQKYLSILSVEEQKILYDVFPGMIQLIYVLIIPVIWLGCGGLAWYYWGKRNSIIIKN